MEIKPGSVFPVGRKTYTVISTDNKFVTYQLDGGPFQQMHGMVSRKFFESLIQGGPTEIPSGD